MLWSKEMKIEARAKMLFLEIRKIMASKEDCSRMVACATTAQPMLDSCTKIRYTELKKWPGEERCLPPKLTRTVRGKRQFSQVIL